MAGLGVKLLLVLCFASWASSLSAVGEQKIIWCLTNSQIHKISNFPHLRQEDSCCGICNCWEKCFDNPPINLARYYMLIHRVSLSRQRNMHNY